MWGQFLTSACCRKMGSRSIVIHCSFFICSTGSNRTVESAHLFAGYCMYENYLNIMDTSIQWYNVIMHLLAFWENIEIENPSYTKNTLNQTPSMNQTITSYGILYWVFCMQILSSNGAIVGIFHFWAIDGSKFNQNDHSLKSYVVFDIKKMIPRKS